ncbi:unnamed protein product [Nippostrongylus brasiliensis]|uniref:Uncharacterized protein n=1 Tax=Nippostrongylus brasiliensis TaxID=27835 RepID=A0A0N4Y832_NIPBR|nr:unnamed protein product [Nippostrongylus brasiliensis]
MNGFVILNHLCQKSTDWNVHGDVQRQNCFRGLGDCNIRRSCDEYAMVLLREERCDAHPYNSLSSAVGCVNPGSRIGGYSQPWRFALVFRQSEITSLRRQERDLPVAIWAPQSKEQLHTPHRECGGQCCPSGLIETDWPPRPLRKLASRWKQFAVTGYKRTT